MDLHCRNCETPCDPLSHYCSWCGVALAKLEVIQNEDQQGHVDHNVDNSESQSFDIGQIRIYVSDEFIRKSKTETDESMFFCEIKNSGVANVVLFVVVAELNKQHNWVLGVSVDKDNPEICIRPNETQKIGVRIQVSSLRNALQKLDLSRMESDLQWDIPLILSRCSLTSTQLLFNQKIKLVLRPNLPVYIQPNMSIYRYIPLELIYRGQFVHHIQITNPSAKPVTIKRVEFRDYPTNPSNLLGVTYDKDKISLNSSLEKAGLQRVSYATLIDRTLANRMAGNTIVAPSDSKAIELTFNSRLNEFYSLEDGLSWFAVQATFYPLNNKPIKSVIAGLIGRQPELKWVNFTRVNAQGKGTEKNISVHLNQRYEHDHFVVQIKNDGDLPVLITNIRVFESTNSRQKGRELTSTVDWLQVQFSGSETTSTLISPISSKDLLLHVEVNQRKDDQLEQLGYRIIEIENTGMESEPLQMFVEAQLGEIEYVGGKFSKDNSTFLCIDFGSSNTSVAIAKRNPVQDPVILDISMKAQDKKEHSISSQLLFKDVQSAELSTTVEGVDNVNFIFGSEAQAQINDISDVSKIDYLLKNIKRTILEKADGNKSEIYMPELDDKEPTQYLRLAYRLDGDEQLKGQPLYLQSLVNVLVKETKRRAELAFIALDKDRKENFSKSQYLRFTEAIFTHPVLTGKAEKTFQYLLYKAAQFSGLNQYKRNGEPMDFDYFVKRCLQNETQSAVATLISALHEGTPLFEACKKDLKIAHFDKNTFIPILNIDMGGGTTDFTYATLNRDDGVWTLQRVYSQGVSFGGDHLDKQILKAILSKFAKENCRDDDYVRKQVERLREMLTHSSFEDCRSAQKLKGMNSEQEDEFKKLYYALDIMLIDIEKIKIRNTNNFKKIKNTDKNKSVESIKLTIKIGPISGSLFPEIPCSPTSNEVELTSQDQKVAVEDAMNDFLEKMDILMMRSGTRYSALYLLLFSGQGYQYPLIEQIILEHMEKQIKSEDVDGSPDHEAMIVIPNINKGLSFQLKDCVVSGAGLMSIRPEMFKFLPENTLLRRTLYLEVWPEYQEIEGLKVDHSFQDAKGEIFVKWIEQPEIVRLFAKQLIKKNEAGRVSIEWDEVVSFDLSSVENSKMLDKKVNISFERDTDAKLLIKMTLSSGQEIYGDIHFPL